MSQTAAAVAESTPDHLELYCLRDDLAASYAPVNAHERMLVTQIARCWLRLQCAYDAEERYFQANDMLEVIGSDYTRYQSVTRRVIESERAWRHAVQSLEQTQRRRIATAGSTGRPRLRPVTPFAAPPQASPNDSICPPLESAPAGASAPELPAAITPQKNEQKNQQQTLRHRNPDVILDLPPHGNKCAEGAGGNQKDIERFLNPDGDVVRQVG